MPGWHHWAFREIQDGRQYGRQNGIYSEKICIYVEVLCIQVLNIDFVRGCAAVKYFE